MTSSNDHQSTPQYHEAPSNSKLYDKNFQLRCLKLLKKYLMTKSEIGTNIRIDLESKIMKTIGLNGIPNPEKISMIPFIHFDDSGEYHFSIIIDCKQSSPWPTYLKNLFGSDFLRLQKEIYDLFRNVNVSNHTLEPSKSKQNENPSDNVSNKSLIDDDNRIPVRKLSAQDLLASIYASKTKKRPLKKVPEDVTKM